MSHAPGIYTGHASTHKALVMGSPIFLPTGGIIDGAEARDPTNTNDIRTLQAGMVMGRITASGKWAPSIIGLTTVAYNGVGVSITVGLTTAAEIVRRIGATGTFKLTGPPTASGTVATHTVTYSAVNLTTGVITVTAVTATADEVQTITPSVGAAADEVQTITPTAGAAVDEVQTITPTVGAAADEVQTITPTVGANADEVHTITFSAAMTAGILDITYYAPDDTPIPVAVPWNASWAQTMADWNTASTAAATVWAGGASVGAVMTGTDTIPVLTFSGVGFTNNPIPKVSVADVSGTTGPTNATAVRTTPGSGVIAGGTWRIGFTDLAGATQWTAPIAYNANAAAINVAIDDALGAGLVVATGGPMSTPAAVVLTFSGAGYTSIQQPMVRIDINELRGCDNVTIVETTPGAGVIAAGTWRLGFEDGAGDVHWTGPIAYNANAAAINVAIDDALGAGLVVATGGPMSTPAAVILTFSGAGYTGRPQPRVHIDLNDLIGCDDVTIVQTTPGSGAIVGGTWRLGITDLNGAVQWTYPIAFDANAAAINTALDDALGAGLVVATGGPMSTPAAVVLTFSGAGYTHIAQTMVMVDINELVGCDSISIVRTTPGAGVISGGTWRIGFTDPNGNIQWTYPIAYNANAAAINTAIDDALGAGLVVATGGPMSTPAAVVLTFSGAGYTAIAQPMVTVDINELIGCDNVSIVETTPGGTTDGRAVIYSLIQPTDGSETPLALIADGTGIDVVDFTTNDDIDAQFPRILIGGTIDASQIVNYPSDASLIAWLKAQLRLSSAGWTFDDDYSG